MSTTLFDVFYSSSGICTDTRAIKQESLFICIKGENFNGNVFASKALEAGASHVILDQEEYFVDNGKMTLVENSLVYLQQLARFHRRKFDIPVIGITGSNGKTTSKELINTVLSTKYNVLATIGNLNNHLGVPFTLLRINKSHDIAIIEMGANGFGDIKELCEIAEPTHGIITNIGKAHLEGFINFEGVLKTKKELYDSIEKSNGTIVVNKDDQTLTSNLPIGVKNHSYGTCGEENIHGELIRLSPFVEMKWNSSSFQSKPIETQMIGKYNFYNYLSAVAFGVLFDVPNNDISNAIATYTPTNNRSQVKKTTLNTLILDCYNANPTSVKSALESFAMNPSVDKLFILGDMKELGSESKQEHIDILKLAENLSLKGYVVGPEFSTIQSDSILNHFNSAQELIEKLRSQPLKNKLILLKGSRSI
ncbi:MAG: UDP-N-acetylmuramoyl-tripeptide--D-alanyl-D-alanine ligase, partial [Crocinitomicaceae bacterium]|nr:UDP-N-acetylmuramoyl-tripeptide--D-alanyl-D-alanine ligase [Crocinitomicaceae bacterium]